MIYLIVAVFLLFYTGFRGNAILTTLYAIDLGANTFQVGMIVALAALFQMILAVYAGRVSDRIGYRYPLMFGSFGVSLAFILPYFIRDQLFVLFLSQSLFGLAFIFVLVNVQNFVGSISTAKNRSQNYAIHSLGISAASVIGPVVAGLSIDYLGYSITYLLFSMMAAVPGILISFKIFHVPRREEQVTEANRSIRELLTPKELRKAYISSAIILTGIGIFEFYLPIYGSHIGFSASIIGLTLSFNGAAYFVIRALMPSLIERFGEEFVFIGSMVVAASAFFLIPFFDTAITLIIISFILGLGLGCGQPLSIVMAYNASPQGRTGEVLGIRLTVNKIVQFSVPIIFGSVGAVLGFFPIFILNALLLFSGGVFISHNRKKLTLDS